VNSHQRKIVIVTKVWRRFEGLLVVTGITGLCLAAFMDVFMAVNAVLRQP